MSKDNDAVPTDDTAPLVFAVQGDPERLVYRDTANRRVLLEPACSAPIGLQRGNA